MALEQLLETRSKPGRLALDSLCVHYTTEQNLGSPLFHVVRSAYKLVMLNVSADQSNYIQEGVFINVLNSLG